MLDALYLSLMVIVTSLVAFVSCARCWKRKKDDDDPEMAIIQSIHQNYKAENEAFGIATGHFRNHYTAGNLEFEPITNATLHQPQSSRQQDFSDIFEPTQASPYKNNNNIMSTTERYESLDAVHNMKPVLKRTSESVPGKMQARNQLHAAYNLSSHRLSLPTNSLPVDVDLRESQDSPSGLRRSSSLQSDMSGDLSPGGLQFYVSGDRRHTRKLLRRSSLTSVIKTKVRKNSLCRSKSVSDISISGDVGSQNAVFMEFKMLYTEDSNLFVVDDVSIANVTSLCQTIQYLYIRCDVIPMCRTVQSGMWHADRGGTCTFDSPFRFEDLSTSNIENSTLFFRLYQAKKIRVSSKDTCCGEVAVELGTLSVRSGEPIVLKRPVYDVAAKIRRRSTSEGCLYKELGELVLILQYHHSADRLKVMIRKCVGLPKSKKLNSMPSETSIDVQMLYNSQMVNAKKTKYLKGSNPNWNEAFLFDISSSNIKDYQMRCLIRRKKLHKRTKTLGHVKIGLSTTHGGEQHWNSMLYAYGREVEKTHNISPMLSYKSCNEEEF